MDLLTLNCHSWQEENQLDKIKYLAKTIVEKQYDVIALQEISQKLYNGKDINEDNFLMVLIKELESLGEKAYSYLWDISHIGYDVYEEGLAILTRHRIIKSESFYVSKNKTLDCYKSRKILKVTISIEGKKIDFYSCHLGWWKDEEDPFKNQGNKLVDTIQNVQTFLMGDFNNNAFVENEGYDYLLNKGLIDTFTLAKDKDSGVTTVGKIDGWKNSSEEKRLDLILTNQQANVEYSKVIFNGINKDIISDHYGVEVRIN